MDHLKIALLLIKLKKEGKKNELKRKRKNEGKEEKEKENRRNERNERIERNDSSEGGKEGRKGGKDTGELAGNIVAVEDARMDAADVVIRRARHSLRREHHVHHREPCLCPIKAKLV